MGWKTQLKEPIVTAMHQKPCGFQLLSSETRAHGYHISELCAFARSILLFVATEGIYESLLILNMVNKRLVF